MWNNFKNNKTDLKRNGFTIIELVISIFILSVAIIGAYNAFTTMDILTSNSTDRLVGAYLAQEGIEIIRNIRDTNWLEGEDWQTGLIDCESGCEADYKTFGDYATPLTLWAGGNYLYSDSDGFYSYDTNSSDNPKFKRKIVIEPMQTSGGEDDVMRVEVTVFWNQKSNLLFASSENNSITVEEFLYNWY